MAPIEEAGQPIVIGGVVIEHKDQKVIFFVFDKTVVTALRRRLFIDQLYYATYSKTNSGQIKRGNTQVLQVHFTLLNWELLPIQMVSVFFFSSLVAIGYFQRKWSLSQSKSITNTSRQ